MGKDSPSPPATPDYTGAANATAAGNLEAARAAAAANRVNQYTPYGNLVYSHDASQGEDNGWSATQTLSPAQQSILDSTNQLNNGLMSTANTGLNYANNVLSKPGVDTSQLPQVGINPGQSYQDAMMARLQPQIDRENAQSDAQLANQGITQGSEAYNNAKTLLGQQHNDLLNNATVQGFNTGMTANQNAFQQQAYNQMQPINVINALRTGSQVQNPSFVSVPQQATTAGADLLGATQAGYNAQLGNYNAQQASSTNGLNGMLGLANTGIAAYGAGLFSDRRLKQNIERIGKLDNGLTLYRFQYVPESNLGSANHIGVMSDEVKEIMPSAVSTHDSGYEMVDYAQVYA
jgi:hypothetical protein